MYPEGVRALAARVGRAAPLGCKWRKCGECEVLLKLCWGGQRGTADTSELKLVLISCYRKRPKCDDDSKPVIATIKSVNFDNIFKKQLQKLQRLRPLISIRVRDFIGLIVITHSSSFCRHLIMEVSKGDPKKTYWWVVVHLTYQSEAVMVEENAAL